MSNTHVNLTLFDADSTHPSTIHEFIAPASSAALEYSFLEKIKEMVERQFSGGLPPHRQLSARDRKLHKDQSAIFIVEWRDFDKMGAKEIQDIFRHRHILVVNWPEKTLKFDRDGLSMLGPMKKATQLQGK
jgi:hypothetical protein